MLSSTWLSLVLYYLSLLKLTTKLKTPPAPVEEAPKGPTAEELLVEIRDALKK